MFAKLRSFVYRLLRKSESYTKTDMVYLAKGGFWLGLGQIMSTFSSFFLAIALANTITPNVYGQYKYILSIVSFLSVFTLPGINTALVQSIARGYDASYKVALKTRIKFGLIGALISLGIAAYYIFFQKDHSLFYGFVITALFIPIMDSLLIADAIVIGKKNFKLSTNFRIISILFTSISLIASVLLSKNIIIIISTYFVANTLVRLYIYLRTIKAISLNNQTDPGMAAYGKHLSFLKGAGIISGNINTIFTYNLLGGASLAIYSVAIAPIEQMRSMTKMIEPLIMPKVASDKWLLPSMRAFYKKIMPFIIITMGIVIIYVVLAPLFYKLFFPLYQNSVMLSQIYAFSLILTAVNIVQGNILKSKIKTKEQYFFTTISSIATIAISVPLIYFYQVMGLIVANMLVKVVELVSLNYLIFHEAKPSATYKPL